MSVGVLVVLEVEIGAADLQVRGFKHADVKRFPTQHKDPLPKIKLTLVEDKRCLDILLYNLLLRLAVRHNLLELSCTVNAQTPCCVARLDNP